MTAELARKRGKTQSMKYKETTKIAQTDSVCHRGQQKG